MDVQTGLEILDGKKQTDLPLKKKWQAVYIQASLHLRGYQPSFKELTYNNRIEPNNYGGVEYDEYFNRFLFSRHPRENKDTREWRLSQYRPLTKAPLQRLLEIVQNGLFAENQYQLSMAEIAEQEYIYETLDVFGFINKNLPAIIEEPNGFIVIMPSKSRLEQKAAKLELKLVFVETKNVLALDDDSILFKYDGYGWLFDRNSIWQYKTNEANAWVVVDEAGYYTHLIGKPTFVVAGGVWNSEGYYNSFFEKALPVCDEFVSVYSASQMIDKEASHPYIVMAAEECPTCNGIGTIQVICDECPEGHELQTCTTCKGKKTISVSPGDRYSVPAELMENDIVKIVNPDVNINTYHNEKEAKLYDKILDALNLLHVLEAQSGIAKALDHEKLYQFLGKISTHIYDNVIHELIAFALQYRNIVVSNNTIKPKDPEFNLVKPTQFQVQSSNDLMLEWENSSKVGTPGFFRKKILIELSDKRFSGDEYFLKKTQVITRLDDLCVFNTDEIVNMVAAGEATIQEVSFSRKLPAVIDDMVEEKSTDWFINAKYPDIKAEILKRLPLPSENSLVQ